GGVTEAEAVRLQGVQHLVDVVEVRSGEGPEPDRDERDRRDGDLTSLWWLPGVRAARFARRSEPDRQQEEDAPPEQRRDERGEKVDANAELWRDDRAKQHETEGRCAEQRHGDQCATSECTRVERSARRRQCVTAAQRDRERRDGEARQDEQ